MKKPPCPHYRGSYHDANRCQKCSDYVKNHTSYDKDGDPYFDPSGSDDVPGLLIVCMLILIVGIIAFFK